ncbi:MAG: HDIG domain-containing protein [Deltaproteobacteria bacterium]|nr:HDIG domain-containing protein [Deltaproteobacteria bacterium]
MIPTPSECFNLLQAHNVPEHIVQHSRVVHRVALYLCQNLNQQGERLDPAQVEAGSLLHDIAKMDGLQTMENHSQAGALLLSRLGYPEIAEIVRQHVILDDGALQVQINEAAVVHYADKRVKHTSVVSLAERFRDLKERYGKNSAALSWLEDLEQRTMELEKRIFQGLSIGPGSLMA